MCVCVQPVLQDVMGNIVTASVCVKLVFVIAWVATAPAHRDGLGLLVSLVSSTIRTMDYTVRKFSFFKKNRCSPDVLRIQHLCETFPFLIIHFFQVNSFHSFLECEEGLYGENCTQICRCANDGRCDRVTGKCVCLPGWIGELCQSGDFLKLNCCIKTCL